MFEKPKVHPPDSFDPSDKADPSIWLWEMEHYMNHFPILKQDGLDRISYATSMLKGDANSWWHFVHEAFHAGLTQD